MNPLTCDKKIVINGNSCIILYFSTLTLPDSLCSQCQEACRVSSINEAQDAVIQGRLRPRSCWGRSLGDGRTGLLWLATARVLRERWKTQDNWGYIYTVGTPYNTNVGVQKIPDRAIWKPVVAKRNNTNPWSCSKPQILVTRDSRQVHMAEQPASRWPWVNFSPHAFITDCLKTL